VIHKTDLKKKRNSGSEYGTSGDAPVWFFGDSLLYAIAAKKSSSHDEPP